MATTLEFHLQVESGTVGKGPSEYRVPVGVTTIGRVSGNRLVLEHEQVSRQHAQFVCSLSGCQVIDQGSSNGTFVNGEKCVPGQAVELRDNDKVKIGPFLLTVSVYEAQEPEETPPVEQKVPAVDEPVQVEVQPEVPEPPSGLPPDGHDGGRWTPDSSEDGLVPPGLSIHSRKLIYYLPGIYEPTSPQMDFFSRFLGIFESILLPIEWNIDNFDLYLSPRTAPAEFLPWLANWFGIILQPYWTEDQRREFLNQAGFIFTRRGTAASLERILEIFYGSKPEIDDTDRDLPPFTFRVRLPKAKNGLSREQVMALIDAHKPVHTSYILEFA